MEIRRSEVYRYLGYGRSEADEKTAELVESCIGELTAKASPRFFGRAFPLALSGECHIDMGCFSVDSRNLFKNLAGCDQVYLFAATIGAGADQLIAKYNRLSMSRAVIMQAAAAAMIEAWCDEKNRELREEYGKMGLYLRPRFSPGYGDLPLSCQRDLIAALEAEKRVGITLTDSLLMMPSKSVTAIIGISPRDTRCMIAGCEACGKKDCAYRRG